MAPLKVEENLHVDNVSEDFFSHPNTGEEIVISGISGSFPDSDGMYMFRDKLLAKVDLVNDDNRRWTSDHPEIPARTGKIYNVEKFDASFFGLHAKQAHAMDPMLRVALERTYEAIIDAGVNPGLLKGTRCGVFVGTCFSESEKTWYYEKTNFEGQGITGCTRSILPNRISYWLRVEGPSYVVDTACSSSLYALEHAYRALRLNLCDSAVVAGANLCLHPYVSLQFHRLGVLSPDGKCKCFDYSADGYCRAEAIPVIFLQKLKNAKRVYARVVHAKTNCDGFKDQGITFPGRYTQLSLLRSFYNECGVDPSSVNFMEAHGTGTRVGDPEECNTLDEIFCQNRKDPLLIGSVKSNMGHSEPSSGLCSVAKAIIAMETGIIPPNLHFKAPREGIPGLPEGRLKVVTEPTPLPGGKIGVNSFGFGGANCHVLLEWNNKVKKAGGAPTDNIPRLITVSGRTKEAIETILDDVKSRPLDAEFVALINEVHANDIVGHNFRGFSILTHGGEKVRDFKVYHGQRPNVTYVFSGMSGQEINCGTMGTEFFQVECFAATIEKLQYYLKDKHVNLIEMLVDSDGGHINAPVLNKILCVVSVQIAMVDMLSTVNINPDAILCDSVGTLSCAYADRCITAEQAILAAYHIGTILQDFVNSREDQQNLVIEDKYHKKTGLLKQKSTNHNGLSNGNGFSEKSLKNHASHLTDDGIISLSNDAKATIVKELNKIIPHPKPRSCKWIASKQINTQKFQLTEDNLFSADFIVQRLIHAGQWNNFLDQVPKASIVVEIAANPLLQPELEKFPNFIQLASNNDSSRNLIQFLDGVGRFYELGNQTTLTNFYPAVSYPVSRGTPMIAPLIRWDHSNDWFTAKFTHLEAKGGMRKVYFTLVNEEYQYLTGHVIDGRNLFPATGYINLVMETVRQMMGELATESQIVFENVKFSRATSIPKQGQLIFTISIQKSSGQFEIVEGGSAIVTGTVFVPLSVDHLKANPLALKEPQINPDAITLSTHDIYKELRLRGYNYSGLFRGLTSLHPSGQIGKIAWHENFVAFIDNMLQIQILNYDNRDLFVPTFIQRLIIDNKQHITDVQKAQEVDAESPLLPIKYYKDVNIIKAGGVEIWNLKAQQIPRKRDLAVPILEKYSFLPYTLPNDHQLDLTDVTRVCMHIVLENVQTIKVKVTEIADEFVNEESKCLSPQIVSVLGDLPLIQQECLVLAAEDNPKTMDLAPGITVSNREISSQNGGLVIVASNLLQRKEFYQQVVSSLKDNGFLLLRESPEHSVNVTELSGMALAFEAVVSNERILLLSSSSKKHKDVTSSVLKIPSGLDFSWISPLKEIMTSAKEKTILLVENDLTHGILGLFNCLRKEPGGEKLRCVYIRDENAPKFAIDNPFYQDQLRKDLAVNVYQNGSWGSYRHQILPPLNNVLVKHITVSNLVKGDLSSFQMFEGPLDTRLNNSIAAHQISDKCVHVCYASINFKDIMVASGKLTVPSSVGHASNEIGLEYCGWDSKRRRVMGLLPNGALTSILIPDPDLLWEIPDKWTMEEAASIPCVYFTCYVALFINGRARRGESILIHSAAGGIGIAALNLSLHLGLNIFVTVGTDEKREFIKKNFPQVPETHIGNSRDLSFEDMIARETEGRGVDLVLNSLAEEKLLASLRCVAEGGRFLEIGKFDFANNNPLPLEPFRKNVSVHSVMVDVVLYGNRELKLRFQKYFNGILKEDIIKPLPTTIFDINETEQAFRYMCSGKHIGKVVLKVKKDLSPEDVTKFEAVPRFFCVPSLVYIVVGGLGGFGMELVNWLIERGGTKFVLTSRKGIKNGYQSYRIGLWKRIGIQVHVAKNDISSETGVTQLLKDALQIGPIAGIFNLAAVLKDALFENQNEADFRLSYMGKAVATELLDKVSRELCPDLRHFVVFSSVVCGRGNVGQTNYGMANSVMERICEKRVADGLPGLAVQWGAVGQVGLVAEMQENNKELVIGGTLQQNISSCLQCLDKFLLQQQPIVASMVVAEKKALGSGARSLVQAVSGIIGIRDLKTVSHHTNLSELGMDSMMAVEIKQTIERDFEIFFAAQDLRALTFAKLSEIDKQLESGVQFELGSVESKKGLDFFIREIMEESIANQRIIELHGPPDLEKDNGKIAFFIPGLDGVPKTFENVSRGIKTRAFCLMYPYDLMLTTSMRHISEFMLPHVESIFENPYKEFTLIGYSIGCIVAIELAFILEGKGLKGKVVCIDGSPSYLQNITKFYKVSTRDMEIENDTLLTIYKVLNERKNTSTSQKNKISAMKSLDEKLEYLRDKFPKVSKALSLQHLKKLFETMTQRLTAVINYQSNKTHKLNSKIILIKAKEQMLPSENSDFDLQQFTNLPVDIFEVTGDHVTVMQSLEIVKVLNNILK